MAEGQANIKTNEFESNKPEISDIDSHGLPRTEISLQRVKGNFYSIYIYTY